MALPVAAIGLGISAASGIAQGIQGFSQTRKGRKALEGLDRPTYEAPEEYLQNVQSAKAASQQGIGAAQKRFFTENILRSRQDALAASSTRRGGLVGLQGIVGQEQQAFGQLAAQDVLARERGQAQLTQARTALGQQRQMEFNINQMQPYQQDLASAQAMIGAGQQNIFGGLSTVAATGIQGAGVLNESRALDLREQQLTGGGGGAAAAGTLGGGGGFGFQGSEIGELVPFGQAGVFPKAPEGGVIQPLPVQGQPIAGLTGGGFTGGQNFGFGNNNQLPRIPR